MLHIAFAGAALAAGDGVADAADFNTDFENTGPLTVDVTTNTATISNNSPGDWTGTVITNAGDINNNDFAHWTGDVLSNSGRIATNDGSTWNGDVTNMGRIGNAGGTWTGDVIANSDTIINDNRGDEVGFGYWNGDVVSNDATIFNGGGGVWTGDVLSNNGMIINGLLAAWSGNVIGNSGEIDSGGTWTGNIESNTGNIGNSGTWTGNVESNAGNIGTNGVWNGDFTSAGTVSAENQINGAFTNSGLLQLTGDLSGITTLTNTGTLAMTGDGMNTLAAATASFGADSYFDVDVGGAGSADKLVAASVTLGGTVRVSGAPAEGSHDYTTPYVIVSSSGITGSFAEVTDNLDFLDASLDYDVPDTVRVMLERNSLAYADVARTPNQRAAAAAAESLGVGNAIHDAIAWLSEDQAVEAFDSLSGEIYASIKGMFIRDADIVADAVVSRIDLAFGTVPGDDVSMVSSYDEAPALPAGPRRNRAVWGRVYGTLADVANSGNTAAMSSETGGIVTGFDGPVGNWRFGVVAQAGVSSATISALKSSASSTDYGLGIYGGRQWGDTLLSLGAAYTRHDVSATRDVVFQNFAGDLSADYSAGTAQAFARLSHEIRLPALSLIPYGSLAYVRHATDGFRETGGDAALTGAADIFDAAFTTVGIEAGRKFVIPNDMLATIEGSVGWRHTFADDPAALNSLAGADFSVFGAPVAGDAAVVSAGLTVDVNGATAIGFTYDGQFGDGIERQSVKASWRTRL